MDIEKSSKASRVSLTSVPNQAGLNQDDLRQQVLRKISDVSVFSENQAVPGTAAQLCCLDVIGDEVDAAIAEGCVDATLVAAASADLPFDACTVLACHALAFSRRKAAEYLSGHLETSGAIVGTRGAIVRPIRSSDRLQRQIGFYVARGAVPTMPG